MDVHSTEYDVPEDLIENGDVFEALADEQRRQLLVDLLDSDPLHVSPLSDSSRELAEANGVFFEQFLSGQVEVPGADRTLLQQHHVHLPKLATYEFIEWYQDDCLVTKGARFDEVEPVLELIED